MHSRRFRAAPLAAAVWLACTGLAQASSHHEAPFITTTPRWTPPTSSVQQLRPGRAGYVTVLANYHPCKTLAATNYFAMDPNALYEIHIDNNGNAKET